MTFNDLQIDPRLVKLLKQEGFETPTPIQQAIIPVFRDKRDVLAVAQTGTGKTGAFVIPLLHNTLTTGARSEIKALILVPTRELVRQIGQVIDRFNAPVQLNYGLIYGGVPIEDQIEALQNSPELIVATPGRLVDLITRRAINLSAVEQFVIDEADRMLDMGFEEDIAGITAQLPDGKNTLLFSATMPAEVKTLSEKILSNPFVHEVSAAPDAAQLIEQKEYYVEKANESNLLTELLRKKEVVSAILFTKTRKSADALHQQLQQAGFVCDRIHSDRSQQARDSILQDFSSARLPILIATDIAARGIDISHISHVFNYELPQEAATYIHRVGRTGRAGKEGLAITLCTPEEKEMLINIQKLMKKSIPVVAGHTFANMALTKALQAADDRLAGKKEKSRYKGSKANGDFFRRQKREQRKK